MKREELELERMNAYIGCGPHSEAELLIMGNEEGTGGYPNEIDAHMVARFLLYGKSMEQTTEIMKQYTALKGDYEQIPLDDHYTYHYGESWKDGFWEPNALGGEKKIENIIMARDGFLPKKSDTYSSFLTQSARIVLGLTTDANTPIETWFQRKQESQEAALIYDQIEQYARKHLFSTDTPGKLRTALMDWRPLPRPAENGWPSLYHFLGMNDMDYLAAYRFEEVPEHMDFVADFVKRRIGYLKSAIVHSQSKLLIMTGDVDIKMKILKKMFPNHHLVFEKLPTRNRSFYTSVEINGEETSKRLHIYLMPFFNYMSVRELGIIVKNFISPDYHGIPRSIETLQVELATIHAMAPKESDHRRGTTPEPLEAWVKELTTGDILETNDKHPNSSQHYRRVAFVGINSNNKVQVNLIHMRSGRRLDTIYEYKSEWLNTPSKPLK